MNSSTQPFAAPIPEPLSLPTDANHQIEQVLETAEVAPELPNSLETIGRLVSGFGDQSTAQYREPVIDPKQMARGLKVTFRPPPKNAPPLVLEFVERLQESLAKQGVNVAEWEEATSPYFYEVAVPLTRRIIKIPARLTRSDIDAVFDVWGRTPLWRRLVRSTMETAYRVHRRFSGLHRRHRIREILRFVWWAEDHAVKNISDHVRTQIVSIRPMEKFLKDPSGDYKAKLEPGLRLLAELLAQMAIGVSEERLSLLNLNLSDTIYPADEMDRFVLKSLIPKLHAPIRPLTKGRFKIGSFDVTTNQFAKRAVELGQSIAPLGLLPDAVSLSQLVRQPSTRDVVDELVNGRSGISFGFVAYVEPPVYVGPREISSAEWERLQPLNELPANEVRRNDAGRWYVRTINDGEWVYRQVPDVWVVGSRSGAEKKDLQLDRDLTRLGFDGSLCLQVPHGLDWDKTDIRPSYDTYVIMALALGAAIHQPHLVDGGAPLVHFHGYPRKEWFTAGEAYNGESNPSVACGTFEAGVLNFVGLWKLAEAQRDLNLAAVIEPDHGCNLIAKDAEYLLRRLQDGIDNDQIVLGGQNLNSLRH